MAEVSEALQQRFRTSDDPRHREPVIVTLVEGAGRDPAGLGLDVTMRARGGTIVAGTVDARALAALAADADVVRIEPEGEVHALGGGGAG